MSSSLFRPEVLAHRSGGLSGRVVLQQPRAFLFFTGSVGLLVLAILALLLVKDHTRKAKASGTLVPDRGLVRIYPLRDKFGSKEEIKFTLGKDGLLEFKRHGYAYSILIKPDVAGLWFCKLDYPDACGVAVRK